jgi:hypothetical protein
VRFHELTHGIHHTLMLFGGPEPDADALRDLAAMARTVQGQHGEKIRTYIVVDGASAPDDLTGDFNVLFDPDGAAHHRYQADLPHLYLIRPDGYIGFRSRPADAAALATYLPRIFK